VYPTKELLLIIQDLFSGSVCTKNQKAIIKRSPSSETSHHAGEHELSCKEQGGQQEGGIQCFRGQEVGVEGAGGQGPQDLQ
jgi:hypothetical protein